MQPEVDPKLWALEITDELSEKFSNSNHGMALDVYPTPIEYNKYLRDADNKDFCIGPAPISTHLSQRSQA